VPLKFTILVRLNTVVSVEPTDIVWTFEEATNPKLGPCTATTTVIAWDSEALFAKVPIIETV
jgi:hypothetical protein